MAIYTYIKSKPNRLRFVVSIISVLSIFSGISLIVLILYPILIFEIYYAPKFGTLLTPVAENILKDTVNYEFSKVLGSSMADYTRASLWFPKASDIKIADNFTGYTITIPKLKIDNASVLVGSEDLTRSLIHFTGPLPGYPGNPVVFGHSTNLLFYNPMDYKSIFSKLPDLSFGDTIFVNSDRVIYQYKVYEMKITSATDLTVLTQNYDNAYLTLITCVPPGTYLKRLIVKTKLVNS